MIRKLVLGICFMLSTLYTHSQIGMRVHYNNNQYNGWNNFFRSLSTTGINNNQRIFSNSIEFTLDYQMRMAETRIEFYPYFKFHQTTSSLGLNSTKLGLRQIGAGLVTHIYLLDLISDCDCPTFGNKRTFMKKGFFLSAGVGADYSTKAVNENYKDGNIDANFQVGLGLDVGVTTLITITPLIRYQYYPDISWHEMASLFDVDINNVDTVAGQLSFGVRIGISLANQ